ncbi:MAG: carboxypeptidase regulatory-like domain-containing protein, partial [Gemmatimonadetes bacterium]|nr:carboxypeptidase regulatory-like domain-containing protein [Gemmatimonadota bacterium]
TDTTGLRFRLSEGTPRAEPAPARTSRSAGTPLTRQEADRLLSRLPVPRRDTTPGDSFIFPPQSPPPPRTGATVRAPFPPPDSAARPVVETARTLEVVRRSPEGEVETGAGVTVVFSQPMVPLSTVGDLAARAVPATLTPQPPGRWRWLDVRTLLFEPGGRLPMATRFTVEVPVGTRSASGAALSAAERWSFATPAPRATGSYPNGGRTVARDPVVVVTWDQRIDPAAVLPTVRLRVGAVEYPVRLATAREVQADSAARAIVRDAETGRWMAFRSVRPLPGGVEAHVAIGPGTPSAEGPLRTTVVQEWSFRTYGPLRVAGRECGYRERCRPGDPWTVLFSNPIDDAAWSDSLVRVEPALPGFRSYVYADRLVIQANGRPNTTYRVHLSPSIRDDFGQRLGRAEPQVFTVGAPVPQLWSVGQGMVVLDPSGPRQLPVYSHDFARLRVRLLRVRPEDWPAFQAVGGRGPRGTEVPLPGREVASRVVESKAGPGEVSQTPVDLTPALEGGLGQVIVAVEPIDPPEEARDARLYLWVQSTRIALTALSDADSLVGWATSLADGSPLAGTRLTLLPGGSAAATGADGLATLPLPTAESSPGNTGVLVARLGADAAILPEYAGRGGWGGWKRREAGDQLAWYVFTDRNLYRPGEEVRFKGWVRRLARSEGGVPTLLGSEADSVRFTVIDAEGNELFHGAAPLGELGGFDGTFTIPAGTHLGGARIHLEADTRVAGVESREFDREFEIQEFRRPEYEVRVTADPGPHRVGGSAEVTARAAYYSGGGLPGAEVKWTVRATPTGFTPPGWDRWTFGIVRGWPGYSGGPTVERTFAGRTDASGSHTLRIDFERAVPPQASSVTAEATVTDVNRQSWTERTQLLVHPAEVYVGVRSERAWIERGQPLEVDLVVVDLAGRPVPGQGVEVSLLPAAGRGPDTARAVDSCRWVSAAEPGHCTLRPEAGGAYRLSATVRDAAGRPSRTEFPVWVSGGVVVRPESPEAEMGTERRVELIPDRREYAPGDTARVLVRAPFFPARGVLSVLRRGIERTDTVRIDGATQVLRVPITERHVPNVQLRLDLVGAAGAPGDSARVRGTDFGSGTVDLPVTTRTRTLRVSAVPRDTVLEPGGRTTVELEVRDAAGRPVPGAEVALVVVDESVLALTGYRLPDPVASFYPHRYPDVRVVRTHPSVLLVPEDFRPAPRTLVGSVADARTGTRLGGAIITLTGTGKRTVTDAYGRFRISDVPPGAYTVQAARAGYASAVQRVTVGTEAPAGLRFALMPEVMEPEGIVVGQAADFSGAGAARGIQEMIPMAPAPPPPPAPARLGPEMARRVRDDTEEPAAAPIALRSDFDPLAAFVPSVRTDAEGRARVEVALPSSLTRYRVLAAAVSGATLAGLGEAGITARKTLMVRPSPPRFLNFGDRFELPVVVQNLGPTPVQVEVAARATGLELSGSGERVTVPAGDRVEVRFPAAALAPGTARVQVAVSGGGHDDAAELAFPVWTPATAEAFATYGTVDSGAVVLPVRVPTGVLPGFGGLEVTTSSTALQELTDALLYLVRYPFECSEQMASRLMSVASLRDVLTAFRAEGLPPPAELQASVDRDVAALVELQNDDGGWGFWRKGEPSWPFVSLHVAHALQRAREKGFAVPEPTLQRATAYLRQVDRNVPAWYPPRVRGAVEAYALYVRGRMGDAGAPAGARALLARAGADSLTLEAKGWLLTTLAADPNRRATADTLLRELRNRATETAATATFATSYGEGEYLVLHSSRRTDAVLLEALMAADPGSDLVPKLVRGLLEQRRRGRWESTQENAWVLLALDRYFAAYERTTPDFLARAWLGERYLGGHRFAGRTTERSHTEVPMRVLAAGDSLTDLTVAKEGAGRMYYRAGVRYAPASLTLAAAQQGFAVERAYEAVDDSADVRRGADGTWWVRPGARVRVRVTMTAPARRVHVALVDPLPAGFEAQNPELRGTESAPPEAGDPGRPWPADFGWRRAWWEHQNLHDDRAEAFTSLLPAGTYTYTYLARATTPGAFVVPPARAEEMYHPETFGRGATDRVRVEDPAGAR